MAINWKSDGVYKYLPSERVKVFPCGWRGKTVTTDGVGIDIDIESKVSTEYNYTHLNGINSNVDTYIKSFDADNGNWEIVIAGYHFRIKDALLSDMQNYAAIDFRAVSLGTKTDGNATSTTNVLKNWHTVTSDEGTTAEQVLDFMEGTNWYFTGLAFMDTKPADLPTTAVVLQLKTGSGANASLNKAALLPQINGGNGTASVRIGEDISITGDNIFAAGDNISADDSAKEAILLGHNVKTINANTITIGNNIKSTKAKQFVIGNYAGDHNENGNSIEPITIADEDIALIGDYGTIIGITNGGATDKNYSIVFSKVKDISIKNSAAAEKIKINNIAPYNAEDFITVNGLVKVNGGFNLAEDSHSYFKTTFTEDKVSGLECHVPVITDKSVTINGGKNAKLTVSNGTTGLFVDVDTAANSNPYVKIVGNDAKDLLKAIYSSNSFTIDKDINVHCYAAENAEASFKFGNNTSLNINKQDTDIRTNVRLYGENNKFIVEGISCFGTGVYFGSTDVNEQVYVKNGEVKATTFWATSDRRAKENITEYSSQKSILDLPVYKYDYIKGPKNQIGCMAQDLLEICPEVVHEEQSGMLSVDNSKVVYLLLNEVKKLRNELNELKVK